MSFVKKVVVLPLAGVAAAILMIPGMAEGSNVVEFNTAPTQTAQQVDDHVTQDLWSGMGQDAQNCWEDPQDRWGRTPATAMVKDDSGVEVYEVSAATATQKSQQGSVWVLAWCE